MNAIIALCHFCEQHGPGVVFCTQTVRDCLAEVTQMHQKNPLDARKTCDACTSIGCDLGFLTTADNIEFLSTARPVPRLNATSLLKQAATRSLSCDIYTKHDGSFVYYGDSTRGHTLSFVFELQDATARGLKRLYSVIILMKDKLFLLNVEPFLSDNLMKIAKELQEAASLVYGEEAKNQSHRMQSTCQSNKNTSPPRSLVALTGEKNVFAHLHSHFCWLLWGGSRYLTDCPTIGSAVAPPWLGKDTAEGFTLIQVDKEEWLIRKKFGENAAFGPDLLQSITALKLFFDSNGTGFISVAYCCLTGVQIVFRGPATVVQILAKGFARLVPEHFDRLFSVTTTNYDSDKRMVCVSSTTTVPQANLKICHVDVASNEQIIVKWPGDVGNKLPQLLQHLVKAFAEPRFTIEILEKQLKVLVMEWKNKLICVQQTQNSHDMNKMKKVLGIQAQDTPLLNYWVQNL